MDPDALLNDIVNDLVNGDWGEARANIADLETWVMRGGRLPRRPRLDWEGDRG